MKIIDCPEWFPVNENGTCWFHGRLGSNDWDGQIYTELKGEWIALVKAPTENKPFRQQSRSFSNITEAAKWCVGQYWHNF